MRSKLEKMIHNISTKTMNILSDNPADPTPQFQRIFNLFTEEIISKPKQEISIKLSKQLAQEYGISDQTARQIILSTLTALEPSSTPPTANHITATKINSHTYPLHQIHLVRHSDDYYIPAHPDRLINPTSVIWVGSIKAHFPTDPIPPTPAIRHIQSLDNTLPGMYTQDSDNPTLYSGVHASKFTDYHATGPISQYHRK